MEIVENCTFFLEQVCSRPFYGVTYQLPGLRSGRYVRVKCVGSDEDYYAKIISVCTTDVKLDDGTPVVKLLLYFDVNEAEN